MDYITLKQRAEIIRILGYPPEMLGKNDLSKLDDATKLAVNKILNPSDFKSAIEQTDLPENKKASIIKIIDNGNSDAIRIIREALNEKRTKRHD